MAEPRQPETSFGFLLNDVARLLRRNLDRRIQHLGLTQAQWRALAYLWWHEGTNQATLAELLDIAPISLARLIDRMEASGWVERRPDPSDRRAVRLFLKPQVQSILSEIWALAAETRKQATEGLTAEERAVLLSALQKMKANLADRECAAPSRVQEPQEA